MGAGAVEEGRNPVSKRGAAPARAVFRPRPDDEPVITTSFLSPNLALASISFCMPPSDGIFQFAICLNPEHIVTTIRRCKRAIMMRRT